MRVLLLLGLVMMVNAQDACPQLTDAGVSAIDRTLIATACYTPKRDHSWNPCDRCLCAVTQELAKAGMDVTDTPALLACGEKLAGVLNYSNVSRDDAIYLVTACPTKCRVTTRGGACPKDCDRRTSWPLVCCSTRGWVWSSRASWVQRKVWVDYDTGVPTAARIRQSAGPLHSRASVSGQVSPPRAVCHGACWWQNAG